MEDNGAVILFPVSIDIKLKEDERKRLVRFFALPFPATHFVRA